MQTDIDPRDLIGHKAVDRNGDKIGTIDEVYLDDATGRPEWAAVRTGIFGRDAFVPLTTSEFSGDELRVPYDKSLVKESPDFGVGQHLSPAQELQLYRYYGLDTPADGRPSAAGEDSGTEPADLDFGTTAGTAAGRTTDSGTAAAAPPAPNGTATTNGTGSAHGTNAARPAKQLTFHRSADLGKPADPTPETPVRTPVTPAPTTSAPAGPAPATAPTPAPAPVGAAPAAPQPAVEPQPPSPPRTTRPETDPAAASPVGRVEITSREERLDITTEWHVVGTARLRKYVTSEQVERRVPVVRERVRVERVPVGEAERALLDEKEIAEAVEEVTLREERPVVRKYLAPVERVRLVVERYTTEEVIREELRREQVEVHDNATTTRTSPAAPASPPPAAPPARPVPARPLA
ncbi:PRC and DUF2382 domain-containing protein [Kitasatospora sp. NPDC002551]|uniref:PRC and DUF2382 domain-containing protein n=1 Tax=Kitasatospora sp. NPDC002551 TaxID=3154539 RepID=UPI00332D7409